LYQSASFLDKIFWAGAMPPPHAPPFNLPPPYSKLLDTHYESSSLARICSEGINGDGK